MTEQYKKGIFIRDYLKKLNMHPVTIAEAVADSNYKKSYQILAENPKITKAEFLEQMNLEEFED